MTFNTLDLFIIGAITVSGLFGLYRGFTSTIMSLITWVVAVWLPYRFTDEFSAFLPASVESPTARVVIAGACLFFGAFIVLSTICMLARKAFGAIGLGFADRLMGLGLGFVRGAVIVAILAMLATYSKTVPKESWWAESKLMPVVQKFSNIARSKLPPNLAKLFVLG